jgi:hypothetical protein
MRRAAKVDGNQGKVVMALRQIGATVQYLHAVGQGCPDLLVGYRGKNILLEVKDGSLSRSRQILTNDEKEWHFCWRGQVRVVNTVEDAIRSVEEA